MRVQCHRNIAFYTNQFDQNLRSVPYPCTTRAPAEVEAGGVLLGEEAGSAVVADHIGASEPFLREAIAATAAGLVRVVWVCRPLLPLCLKHGEGEGRTARSCRRRRVQERWCGEPHEARQLRRMLERRAVVRRGVDVVEHHARVAVRGAVLADRRLALLCGVIGCRRLQLHRRLWL